MTDPLDPMEYLKRVIEVGDDLPRLTLTSRQLCDLELLLNGAFHPLKRFLSEQETDSVLSSFRLPDGTFWPMPILLAVNNLEKIGEGKQVLLCDAEGHVLSLLDVDSVWKLDKNDYVRRLFGTEDEKHPGVHDVLKNSGSYCLNGVLHGLGAPRYYDFSDLRHTPAAFRKILKEKNVSTLVGFNTRNPMHRAHYQLTLSAVEELHAALLIHPVVGPTRPGDIDYVTRVKCYQSILKYYHGHDVFLSLLPLAMRMAGPREALLHGIIRKNYGCTHFIVGREHASPGLDSRLRPFYGPYDAQELFLKHEKEMGIKMIPFREMSYLPDRKAYIFQEDLSAKQGLHISGTELRESLQQGKEIPEWFSFPEVVHLLRKTYPPRHERGLAIFFTGLSASGKSTIARHLEILLRERTGRKVSLLDGDLVRKNLSDGLGFSKEDRDKNVHRIGFVANEIVKHKGICICCAIAPYEEVRLENRRLISEEGGSYVEVYVSTPLEICKKRDPKGFYAEAICGNLKQFTGIDDPYEPPTKPEMIVDTLVESPMESANRLLDFLTEEGFLENKSH